MKEKFEITPLDDNYTLSVDEAILSLLKIKCNLTQYVDGETYRVTLSELFCEMQEHAQTDVENSQADLIEYKLRKHQDKNKIAHLEKTINYKKELFDKTKSKTKLASQLVKTLNEEASKAISGKKSILVIDSLLSKKTGIYQITKNSFNEWVNELNSNRDITISKSTSIMPSRPPNHINWEDVTVKIQKDYRLSYSFKKGHYHSISFFELGLMGKRKNLPNKIGETLIKLSEDKMLYVGRSVSNSISTNISKLRKKLKEHIGINKDPFTHNKTDGYQPRFKLIDDRNNIQERAEREVKYLSKPNDNPHNEHDYYDNYSLESNYASSPEDILMSEQEKDEEWCYQ